MFIRNDSEDFSDAFIVCRFRDGEAANFFTMVMLNSHECSHKFRAGTPIQYPRLRVAKEPSESDRAEPWDSPPTT